MDYKNRLARIRDRYNPDSNLILERRFFSEIPQGTRDVEIYVKRAMRAVEPDYTSRTKEAGEMVKAHLSSVLTDISYDYQGSVMTDTHIKGASDIDLLVVCEKFNGTEIDKVRKEVQKTWLYDGTQLHRLNQFKDSFSQYQGNSNQDLSQLRADIERKMIDTYEKCDISKPKSVKITNQHLHRDVDIVVVSWFDSLDYVLKGSPKEYRGIKIFNKDLGYAIGPDYPFLSISRINGRSAQTDGRLKRMIRFLKNVKEDSEKDIQLTSFEINAICYSIPVEQYCSLDYKQLVFLLWSHMYNLLQDENKLNNLISVVGTEYPFRDKPLKKEALRLLKDEVWIINVDLNNIKL